MDGVSMTTTADFIKAALKRNRLIYRAALWLYVRLLKFRGHVHVLLGVVQFAMHRLGVRMGVLSLDDPALRDSFEFHRHRQIFRAYDAGDLSFHRGLMSRAFRQWRHSLETQARAEQELFSDSRKAAGATELLSGFWTVAIGHIALLDSVVKLSRLGLLEKDKLRLYVQPKYVANQAYLGLLSPYVEFVDFPSDRREERRLALVDQKLNIIRTKRGPLFLYDACALAEREWAARGNAPLLTLPDSYWEFARSRLISIGWDPDKWFVTLHVRGPRHRSDRLDSTRNTTLDHYVGFVEMIHALGGQVVLLGERGVSVPEQCRAKLVDYANSQIRDGRIDVFLCGGCRFFLGTSSGISHVPGTFGVHAVFSNVSPVFSRPWREGDIWIPKRLWSDRHLRYLSLREMMSAPSCLLDTQESQAQHGLRAIDNDDEEITCAVNDMLDQLAGRPLAGELRYVEERSRKVLTQFDHSDGEYMSLLSPRFARRHKADLGLL
jgi:putative glycosyltransferase (TIGR04372 family)